MRNSLQDTLSRRSRLDKISKFFDIYDAEATLQKRRLDEITTTQEKERANKRTQRRFAGARLLGTEEMTYRRAEEEKKAAAKALQEA